MSALTGSESLASAHSGCGDLGDFLHPVSFAALPDLQQLNIANQIRSSPSAVSGGARVRAVAKSKGRRSRRQREEECDVKFDGVLADLVECRLVDSRRGGSGRDETSVCSAMNRVASCRRKFPVRRRKRRWPTWTDLHGCRRPELRAVRLPRRRHCWWQERSCPCRTPATLSGRTLQPAILMYRGAQGPLQCPTACVALMRWPPCPARSSSPDAKPEAAS